MMHKWFGLQAATILLIGVGAVSNTLLGSPALVGVSTAIQAPVVPGRPQSGKAPGSLRVSSRLDQANNADLRLYQSTVGWAALEPVNATPPVADSDWYQLAEALQSADNSVTESEDCYTELNKQIKQLLNKLDKYQRLLTGRESDGRQSAAMRSSQPPVSEPAEGEHSRQEHEHQSASSTGYHANHNQEPGDERNEAMQELVDRQLRQLDRRLVERDCHQSDLPRPDQHDQQAGGSPWKLPFDPTQVDYIYMTLKDYKEILDEVVNEVQKSLDKPLDEIIAGVHDKQGNIDLEYCYEVMNRLRDGLIAGGVKAGVELSKKAIREHAVQMIGNFVTKRSEAPDTSLGLFGPIIDMIGGGEARIVAQYLLDHRTRSAMNIATDAKPPRFLACQDPSKLKQPQC